MAIRPAGSGKTIDPYIAHAADVIYSTYGDLISIEEKAKDLLKFGRNRLVGTSKATLQIQPVGILNETYVSTNLINTAISTAADTQDIVIEGHTTDDGGLTFTFVTQTITLTGTTAKALTTPLARVTRVYNNSSTELTGLISITETDTYTAGVPNTASKVHLQITAGQQNSYKCSTTISNSDYWILTSFYADILSKTAAYAEIGLEIRQPGKVFRTSVTKGAGDSHDVEHQFKPYLIVPKNSDVRLTAIADGAGTDIAGGIEGILASVLP